LAVRLQHPTVLNRQHLRKSRTARPRPSTRDPCNFPVRRLGALL